MIQLSSAGKRFGPKLLFDNLDWLITPRERVGLVGANGTGKSTLLEVLGGRVARLRQRHRSENTTSATCLRTACGSPAVRCSMHACPCSATCARWSRRWKISLRDGRTRSHASDYAQVADRYQRSGEFRAQGRLRPRFAGGTVLDGSGLCEGATGQGTRKSSPAAGRCGLRSPSCCWQAGPAAARRADQPPRS